MDLLLWQISFVMAIFFAVGVCCMMPILLLRGRRLVASMDTNVTIVHFWKRLFSWCDCLTGGVFLAICFLSLLPNVQDQMDIVLHNVQFSFEFPVAECAVLLGFFAVLIVDQAGKRCEASRIGTKRIIEMDSLGILDRGGDGDEEDDASEDRCTLLATDDSTLPNGNGQLTFGDADDFEVGSPSTEIALSSARSTDQRSGPSATRLFRGGTGGRGEIHRHHARGHVLDLMEKGPSREGRALRLLFLLLALGIHALFEGIVLGLQTEIPKAVHLFTAIIVHESVVAATFGFSIAKARYSAWTAVRYSLLFSVCIPVGIGLGAGMGQTPGILGHAISGSVQALAAGIFLHITFMQLLPYELGHGSTGHDGLVKTLFLFIGFLMMTTLNLAVGFVH